MLALPHAARLRLASGPRVVAPEDASTEGVQARAPRTPRRASRRLGEVRWWQTWRRPSWRWLAVLVALSALANLGVLLAQTRSLLRSVYANADNASALVLPALSGHAPPGSVVNLGDHPWYEPWWYMRATAGLPHYHQLWEAVPLALGLLGIAVVTACAWRALGPLAALLCGAALIAVSEPLRQDLYVPEAHGLVLLHLGVLCGVLLIVLAWARTKRLTPVRLLLLGVPFVVFTGAGLTDQLLIVSGLGAFVLAPLLCWWRLRTRVWLAVSGFAVGTSVLSGVIALELAHAMQEQRVIHAPFPIDFVAVGSIVGGFENLLAASLALGGGSFLGGPVSGENLFTFIAGVIVLLALVFVVRALWRWAHAVPRAATSTAPDAGSTTCTVGPPARELFIAFWGLVMVCVVAAFVLTNLSVDEGNTRYLIGAWAALAALLGVLATSVPARAALLVGVAAFGALNVRAELASGVPPSGWGPNMRLAGEIERFAAAHGATVGYGSYWDSAPVTWETRQRVRLYPIQTCDTSSSGWCGFYGNQINTWYLSRPHTHTFLLTDARPGIPAEVIVPPAAFGHPIAGESLGEGLTLYIYGRDLASYLSPP